MGKGGLNYAGLALQEFDWDEVKKHNTRADKWVVIDGAIYDVTRWGGRHPGGDRILAHFAGQDATEAWYAFHPDKAYVTKYMKTLLVGRLKDHQSAPSECSLVSDFKVLRKTVEDMGMFRPSPLFFLIILLHVLALDVAGMFVMKWFGTGWLSYIVASCLLATAQIQAGWAQHDYGHLSVFSNNKLNHWVQIFIVNVIKGGSAAWWNHRHLNHHAKPNVLNKDPDVRFAPLFLVGKSLPKKWGAEKKKMLPYNQQHKYFFLVLPPLLMPLYFNFEIPYYLYTRKQWTEMLWLGTFFLRWYVMFGDMLGVLGILGLFMFVRFLESHWFVWTTQMSHMSMQIEEDAQTDWVTSQLSATCNVEQGAFNDWFSGHLNFQIEHHLFPTMPRHNFHKVAPLVRSLCKKHGLDYKCKTMLGAFADIVGSLRSSGQLWYDAYQM